MLMIHPSLSCTCCLPTQQLPPQAKACISTDELEQLKQATATVAEDSHTKPVRQQHHCPGSQATAKAKTQCNARERRQRGRHGISQRSCGWCKEPWVYAPPAPINLHSPMQQRQQQHYAPPADLTQQMWPSLQPVQPAPVLPPSLGGAALDLMRCKSRLAASTDSPRLAQYKALLQQPPPPRQQPRRHRAHHMPATTAANKVSVSAVPQATSAQAADATIPRTNIFMVLLHDPETAAYEDDVESADDHSSVSQPSQEQPRSMRKQQQQQSRQGKTSAARRLQQPCAGHKGTSACTGGHTATVHGRCGHSKPRCGCPVAQQSRSTGRQLAMFVALWLFVAAFGVLSMPVTAHSANASCCIVSSAGGVVGGGNVSQNGHWCATACVLCAAVLAWLAAGPCKRPLACALCMRQWRHARYLARRHCALLQKHFLRMCATYVMFCWALGVFAGFAFLVENWPCWVHLAVTMGAPVACAVTYIVLGVCVKAVIANQQHAAVWTGQVAVMCISIMCVLPLVTMRFVYSVTVGCLGWKGPGPLGLVLSLLWLCTSVSATSGCGIAANATGSMLQHVTPVAAATAVAAAAGAGAFLGANAHVLTSQPEQQQQRSTKRTQRAASLAARTVVLDAMQDLEDSGDSDCGMGDEAWEPVHSNSMKRGRGSASAGCSRAVQGQSRGAGGKQTQPPPGPAPTPNTASDATAARAAAAPTQPVRRRRLNRTQGMCGNAGVYGGDGTCCWALHWRRDSITVFWYLWASCIDLLMPPALYPKRTPHALSPGCPPSTTSTQHPIRIHLYAACTLAICRFSCRRHCDYAEQLPEPTASSSRQTAA